MPAHDAEGHAFHDAGHLGARAAAGAGEVPEVQGRKPGVPGGDVKSDYQAGRRGGGARAQIVARTGNEKR